MLASKLCESSFEYKGLITYWGHLRKEVNCNFKDGFNEAQCEPIADVCDMEAEDVGEDDGEQGAFAVR